jgi:hypothetical protein
MAIAGLGWLTFLSPPLANSAPLYSCPRRPRGTSADAMAACDGRERATMEGTGQRSMKAAVAAIRPASIKTGPDSHERLIE